MAEDPARIEAVLANLGGVDPAQANVSGSMMDPYGWNAQFTGFLKPEGGYDVSDSIYLSALSALGLADRITPTLEAINQARLQDIADAQAQWEASLRTGEDEGQPYTYRDWEAVQALLNSGDPVFTKRYHQVLNPEQNYT